ncbi:retropepsin-like aspartic protease family protein [Limoniibacter endophyticus]|uniref:Peptidase A2 domain-containing protein n=1 Tax=Limoniibacter endophyticus TaxID=1565040 RepID=A0A8J3DQ47_9HYPH|nr:TIGR02281 family clan AA aspartic protease [Limoniibacter endophyticus]GHC75777.1 hypothetical protein GCM10010136_26050 [Limoniibacter endophyticus]
MKNPIFIIIVLAAAVLGYFFFSQDTSEWVTPENDRIVRGIYLVVLAVLLLSSLSLRQFKLGDFGRNIAIWLLFAVLLAAGYQYRFELNEIASRVGAGFLDGTPVALGPDETGRKRMMVDRDSTGHFFVRAEINGTTIRALLDTGASTTLLTTRDAKASGIDTENIAYDVPVSTANGTTFVAAARIDELKIGDITRGSQRVYVAKPGSLHETLIGMSFINTLSSFELRGNRVILYD